VTVPLQKSKRRCPFDQSKREGFECGTQEIRKRKVKGLQNNHEEHGEICPEGIATSSALSNLSFPDFLSSKFLTFYS
jgi:hypothetical protein